MRKIGIWCWTLILLGTVSCLSGCFGPVVLDGTADGTIQMVDLGDVLIVELRGNPTTGYEWRQTDSLNQAVLEPRGYEYIPERPEIVGSGGLWRFRFKAVHTGSTPLELEYRRSWEEAPIETFSVIVTVR
jgi:predicted secreted protein